MQLSVGPTRVSFESSSGYSLRKKVRFVVALVRKWNVNENLFKNSFVHGIHLIRFEVENGRSACSKFAFTKILSPLSNHSSLYFVVFREAVYPQTSCLLNHYNIGYQLYILQFGNVNTRCVECVFTKRRISWFEMRTMWFYKSVFYRNVRKDSQVNFSYSLLV